MSARKRRWWLPLLGLAIATSVAILLARRGDVEVTVVSVRVEKPSVAFRPLIAPRAGRQAVTTSTTGNQPRSAPLEKIVRGACRLPAEGVVGCAPVELRDYHGGIIATTSTSTDGAFEIRLPADTTGSFLVMIRHPRAMTLSEPVTIVPQRSDYDLGELDLELGVSLQLRLVDPVGSPIVGASCTWELIASDIRYMTTETRNSGTVRTTDTGLFSVLGLPNGFVSMTVTALDGRVAFAGPLAVKTSLDVIRDVVIAFEEPLMVSVTSSSGRPITSLSYRLSGRELDTSETEAASLGVAGDGTSQWALYAPRGFDGTAVFRSPHHRQLAVGWLQGRGHGEPLVLQYVSDAVTIPVIASGVATGRQLLFGVLDRADGTLPRMIGQMPADDGKYYIPAEKIISEGAAGMIITTPDWLSVGRISPSVLSDAVSASSDLRVVLERAPRLGITVTRSSSLEPIVGATCSLHRDYGRGAPRASPWGTLLPSSTGNSLLSDPICSTTTDEGGRATLPLLDDFSVAMTIDADGYETAEVVLSGIGGGGALTVQLRAAARISLVDADPAARDRIGAIRIGGPSQQHPEPILPAELNGGLYFDRLQSGTYLVGDLESIRWLRMQFAPSEIPRNLALTGLSTVTVAEGETQPVNLTGDSSRVWISGTIRWPWDDLHNMSLDIVPIQLSEAVRPRRPIAVRADGGFHLGPIPVGDYAIRVFTDRDQFPLYSESVTMRLAGSYDVVLSPVWARCSVQIREAQVPRVVSILQAISTRTIVSMIARPGTTEVNFDIRPGDYRVLIGPPPTPEAADQALPIRIESGQVTIREH